MRGRKRLASGGVEPSHEVFDSADKLVVWLLFGLLMLLFGSLTVSQPNGWMLGLPVAAWGLCLSGAMILRMMLISSPTIVVDAAGVHDRRLTSSAIPWAFVDMVVPVRGRFGISAAGLRIQERHVQRLSLVPTGRALRWISSLLGSSTISISAIGTKLTGEQIYNLCLAYSRLHKMQDVPANV